jgi:ABC-2 type transport system ATP-binding protein
MRRVDEVLDLVGLSNVADKRVGGFSLGMGQRLGIAVALLGDPAILILDEPVNGLDVDGVRWIRELLRSLADEGRTVLLSSHLLNEMAMTADHLVVIRRGQLIADSPTGAFLDRSSQQSVAVESPDMLRLAALVESAGGRVELLSEQAGTITELATATVGELAALHGLTLHELATRRPSLEDAFVELTHDTSDIDTSDLIGSTS